MSALKKTAQRCGFVIFGAKGDLTERKLIPALHKLFRSGLMPDDFFILGCDRKPATEEAYRSEIGTSIGGSSADFLNRCYYLQMAGDNDMKVYAALKQKLDELNREYGTEGRHIFHFSTPPETFGQILKSLNDLDLVRQLDSHWPRVAIEKPIGYSLESAKELEKIFQEILKDEQIYRIDHYLGKHTIKAIPEFRSHPAVESIWNATYIDHVQITAIESGGMAGRGGFYEKVGALRDMVQNHMIQIVSLIAMELPKDLNRGTVDVAKKIREKKIELMESIDLPPEKVLRGQYLKGRIGSASVPSYRHEVDVEKDSHVETFVAAKMLINNERWEGVPFYVRTGKRLADRIGQIAITFKAPISDEVQKVIKGMSPQLWRCDGKSMILDYQQAAEESVLSEYECLYYDCMSGDQTLFVHHDEVIASWNKVDPILEQWGYDTTTVAPDNYPKGTSGKIPTGAFYTPGSQGPKSHAYSIQSELYDGIEVFSLGFSDTVTSRDGVIVRVVPEWGNNCVTFRVGEIDILESVGLNTVRQRPGSFCLPILFPFANRICHRRFHFHGRTYDIDRDQHGLVRDKPWRVQAMGASARDGAWIRSSLDATHFPDEILHQFPFPFRISVTYHLRESTLEMRTRIENTGLVAMPCGYGIHPYFRRPVSGTIQVPARNRLELQKFFPTGTRLPVAGTAFDLQQPVNITTLPVLDDIFTDLIPNSGDGWVRCCLTDTHNQLETHVEFDSQQFPHVVVFTPDRDAIAIELYSCPTDAFNLQHHGILSARGIDTYRLQLAPDEVVHFTIRISVRK